MTAGALQRFPSALDSQAPEARDVEVSVVVPVHNEAGNIAPLIAEIDAAMRGLAAYEIVYVDDGSDDGTAQALAEARDGNTHLRVIRHREKYGQSAAIWTGVKAARGGWIATLDGDGQNDPADIGKLLARLRADNAARRYSMVSGVRDKRRDNWVRRLSSRIANGARRRLLDDGAADTGCGIKVFDRDTFLALPRFDHMHRFLPALFQRAGGAVAFEPVNHRPRVTGRSKYGVGDRLWTGIADLLGVMWLQRRARVPVIDEEE
jgi:dolichol-phosphate mannosyltransferase